MEELKSSAKATPKMMRPARNADVAFVAAETVLGFRSIQFALMALRAGDMEKLDSQINIIGERADTLWKRFEQLTGTDDE